MIKIALDIPEKIFGIDSANIILFTPLLVVVLFVIVSVNLVFVPKYEDLQVMQGNLAVIDKETEMVLEKTRYLQSIDPEELEKNANFLSSALMPQQNAYTLVNVIRKVVTKFGFQIDSFLINPGRVGGKAKLSGSKGVSKIPINVVISGPKSGYLELIKSIERTLPVLSITSFKMTSIGSLVKLDLEVTAFYVNDETVFDMTKLTLADLTLKQEETDLVANISSYEIVEKGEEDVSRTPVEFQEYDRTDPFSP